MLDKIYNAPPTDRTTRYSPAECCGTRKLKIKGNPDIVTRINELCGAAESHHADEHAPDDAG